MTPEQEKKLDDIHLAVVGNEKLGISGLVNEMRHIKEWRRSVELRVAAIAGGITMAVMTIKYFVANLFRN